jgi:glucose-6-phosphate 1-dehydrogenase
VIFGATGDLAARLLMPALVNLAGEGLLDEGFAILGVATSAGDDAMLRDRLARFLADGVWHGLDTRISYRTGDFRDPGLFQALARDLRGNVAFYCATAPDFFGLIAEQLAAAGLLDESDGFRRIVVEKPFGHDLESARAHTALLGAVAAERQIYRIDHFLGKETVRNIMVARFGNAFLEAVWNSHHIDHVEITAAETVDVGRRGTFYDATGALRDMVPNHLLQILAMVAMEPPNSFAAEPIRDEKAKLIDAVRVPTRAEAATDAVRGRYTAGTVDGRAVRDYREENDVSPDSRTETYAALKLYVDSWRWAGVPFYLRTGKALARRDTEVVITFKPVALALFRDIDASRLPPNKLILQIQPDEGSTLNFLAKRPGPDVETAPVTLDFRYADHFHLARTTGYETLLYDVLIGDQALFQRADMVELGWEVVQPILDLWAEGGAPEPYVAGTGGPDAAERLMARDGHAWHGLGR